MTKSAQVRSCCQGGYSLFVRPRILYSDITLWFLGPKVRTKETYRSPSSSKSVFLNWNWALIFLVVRGEAAENEGGQWWRGGVVKEMDLYRMRAYDAFVSVKQRKEVNVVLKVQLPTSSNECDTRWDWTVRAGPDFVLNHSYLRRCARSPACKESVI